MCIVLAKDMIEFEIVPYIPKTKRVFLPSVPLVEIINTTL